MKKKKVLKKRKVLNISQRYALKVSLLQVAFVIRNLLITILGLDPTFLSLEIKTLSPEKTISWKDILQLGKGRRHDPLGGAPPPPNPPVSEDFFDFWLKKFRSLGPILA